MQKKRNTRFRVIDLGIILICLSGSFLSGAAFRQEYNRTFTKLNESPVGTVTFKKRTAQRKFIDRVVWDRLKQASDIYNGDTIRTIEFSEALITFKNEVTHISLSENTLIQIFYNDVDGVRIELSGGNLEVVSGAGNVIITSGSARAVVEGHASFNMNEEVFSISVFDGETILDGETVKEGNIISLSEDGERHLDPSVMMKSFGSSVRVLAPSGSEAPVEFSWITANFNPDTYVIVEVALNKRFSRMVQKIEITDSDSVIIPLVKGNYWWKVYPADSNSRGMSVNKIYPYGTLEVIDENNYNLPEILPVTVITREPEVEPEPEPEPVIAVAPLPQPLPPPPLAPQSQPARQQTPPSPPVITEPPPPVITEPPPPVIAEPPPPPTPTQAPEQLRQVSGTGTITNVFPPDNYVIYTDQIQSAQSLYFSWEGTSAGYEFALLNENGNIIVPRTDAAGTTYILNNPSVLTEGTYIWHIYEKGRRRETAELPSLAISLTVRRRTQTQNTLPTIDPGELYGN